MLDTIDDLDVKAKIKFPECEKANSIFNVIFGLPAAQALHVAHKLNLFEMLAKRKEMSLQEISTMLKIELRPTQALISMCAGLGFLRCNRNQKFELTETSTHFLLKESPFYAGGMLDTTLMNSEVYSFKSFEQAIQNNASQVYQGKELFKTNEEQAELAKGFTRCMHGKSMALAGVWPKKINLSAHHRFLDVGGGSGAHSIGAALQWPNLQAIVYDRPVVCEVAEEYIDEFALSNRIKTHVGDMWLDPFPEADVHFYCDIFHDWSMEQCKFLIQKTYNALKSQGRILISELLFNDDKTGPSSVASYNIMMLLWTQKGQQLSRNELITLLQDCGFVDIQVIATGFGDWSLVSGLKA